MKLALVGATGLVGGVMCRILEEFDVQPTEFYPVASARSAGKPFTFRNKEYTVLTLEQALEKKPDYALFSAGGGTSTEWAPRFAEIGCTVIDNSSAWRMDPTKKLIVPEINAHLITPKDKIIANPNCSTIQMVMVLAPLHRQYGIQRVVVSTYQSITGTGVKAVQQLDDEAKGIDGDKAYPHPIHKNALPHCDIFLDNGYTKEEMKLTAETKKIIGDDGIQVVATAVRIPVVGGHSESVNIQFAKEFEVEDVRNILQQTDGVEVVDNPAENEYPMPLFAEHKNEVLVGRIRRDFTQDNTLNAWIVSDNLRKGAATNAVQILKHCLQMSTAGSEA